MLVYEFKLRGKPSQFEALEEALRTVQFIRNKAVRYWMDNRGTGKYDLSKLAASLAAEFPFVAKLNSTARQQSTERAWTSISKFFSNCKKGIPGKKGYPKFQRLNRSVEYKQSGWRLSDDCRHLSLTDGHKAGTFKLLGKQILNPFKSKIKRVRVVKRADGFFAQFVIDAERQIQVTPSGSAVGLDFGLTHLWTASNGETMSNPRNLRSAEQSLKREQRRLSRKKKGSSNRKKQIKKLARKHLKVSRRRKDFAIKAAKALCQSHDLIVLEDLKVRNMVRNSRMAKSIHDASWGMLRDKIQYFSKLLGKVCVLVDPKYTSQDCSACNARLPEGQRLLLSNRIFNCPSCGACLDRDHNAALNILQRGLAKLSELQLDIIQTVAGGTGKPGEQVPQTPVDSKTSGAEQ